MPTAKAKSEPLVHGHIRDVSVIGIERHLKSFRAFLGTEGSGIYVLRKNQGIYYIGLAGSLRSRIADHLKTIIARNGISSICTSFAKANSNTLESLRPCLLELPNQAGTKQSPILRGLTISQKVQASLGQ